MARRGVLGGAIPTAFTTVLSCRESLVDVTADQVLRGCTPPAFERFGDRGPGGRGEVFPRRLGAAPGVRQGIREPHPEPACKGVVPRSQLQGQAV